MDDMLITLFGAGSPLSLTQMVLRAVVVFMLTLLMIRISGRRSLGQHSPFDACITVLLGAVLSRALVGASPFVPTMAAGLALVLLHRGVALLSARSERISGLCNGSPRLLLRAGQPDVIAMRKALVSQADLAQALREHGRAGGLSEIREIFLERNGVLTVIANTHSS